MSQSIFSRVNPIVLKSSSLLLDIDTRQQLLFKKETRRACRKNKIATALHQRLRRPRRPVGLELRSIREYHIASSMTPELAVCVLTDVPADLPY